MNRRILNHIQKTIKTGLIVLCACLTLGWLDYTDQVKEDKPVFGKESQGFALKLETAQSAFEQESSEKITITLQNTNSRGSLLPLPAGDAERIYALYIIMADEEGNSLFSKNLLPEYAPFVAAKQIPGNSETTLVQIGFDKLELAKVTRYIDGMPDIPDDQPMIKAASRTPEIYLLRAILISTIRGTRPDFTVASNLWRIMLKPKSVSRMSEAERQEKRGRYLKKLQEGAYGGLAVSSQLAAFGDEVVDSLIAIAEKKGEDAVRESRIWAIVTLCNTGSARAEEYILERIKNPVEFGDLAFLVWHSQGFHSEKVTFVLQQFAEDIAAGRELPWEKAHGAESRRHGWGSMEYLCKHFIQVGASISDITVGGCIDQPDQKIAAFALSAWQPSDAGKAVQICSSLFTKVNLHPNVKKAVMRALAEVLTAQGFPEFNQATDIGKIWFNSGIWLIETKLLEADAAAAFLKIQLLEADSDSEKKRVIVALQKYLAPDFPVDTVPIVLPRDWVRSWQWALQDEAISREDAIAFLCNQMRHPSEVVNETRVALLVELKNKIGAEFPLKNEKHIDPEIDWNTCGAWLVENGYFGRKGQSK